MNIVAITFVIGYDSDWNKACQQVHLSINELDTLFFAYFET